MTDVFGYLTLGVSVKNVDKDKLFAVALSSLFIPHIIISCIIISLLHSNELWTLFWVNLSLYH